MACVELSADRFYICLIDVNGAADLPRQLGGWTVERDDRELLQRLLSGRLVVKTTDDPMPEVDQAEVAGYFTVDDTVSKVEAEIAELKNRFNAVLESPERQGLGALTEPRWPDLELLTTRTPNPQSSREGQGRAAFTLGVTVKDLATGWGKLESIRLTAAYPLPRDPGSPKSHPRQFRYYLNDDSSPDARPLPVGDR
ncbi:hypothetical protein AB0P13_22195 [Rhodococcus pyridinivorans]|uniref:hypothetical protein n=1 Tax=Rhodococcus pyridinivorans TaxID=103816 RepID=UPI0034266FD1